MHDLHEFFACTLHRSRKCRMKRVGRWYKVAVQYRMPNGESGREGSCSRERRDEVEGLGCACNQ